MHRDKFDIAAVQDARNAAADAQCAYVAALTAAIESALDDATREEKDHASAVVAAAGNADKIETEIEELEDLLSRLAEDDYGKLC